MESKVNEIFKGTGLKWISGYSLPEVFVRDPTKHVYVAQMAIATENPNEYAVIACANIGVWLETYSQGQMIQRLATEKGYHLKFQMVPSHPGWAYLNCFMTFDEGMFN